jgi:MOSC domain-containing protein YiiM
VGNVLAIFTAAKAGEPLVSRDEVRAVPGRGLDGDRYFSKAGTYSAKDGPDREVTFIEREAIDAAERDEGVVIPPEGTRRNILTRGVALNHLVGREFSVGDVRFLGIRLSEPCAHMEKLSGVPGARKVLIHRGGLRAQILNEGVLRVGDPIDTSD